MANCYKLNPMEQLLLEKHRLQIGLEKCTDDYLNSHEAVLEYDQIPSGNKWVFATEIADQKRKEIANLRKMVELLEEIKGQTKRHRV
ncbi:MAG: hypothetical protein WCT49_02410 [Candidatus Paceibacterota bacterium]|nr:hypothetical protein [Candidatus Paceibacterota bacterium]